MGETLRIARLRIKELEAETNIQTTELNRLKEYVNASESAGRTMYGQQVDELKQVCTWCQLTTPTDNGTAGVSIMSSMHSQCLTTVHAETMPEQVIWTTKMDAPYNQYQALRTPENIFPAAAPCAVDNAAACRYWWFGLSSGSNVLP